MAFVHRHQTASQADVMVRSRAVLRRVRTIFPGQYENRRQRALELFQSHPAPHTLLIVQVDPIYWPDETGCAFLLRAYAAAGGAPALARVYAFAAGWPGPGPVRLAVHTFDTDPRVLAANLDPAAMPDLSGAAEHSLGRDMTVAMRGGAVVCRARPVRGKSGAEGAAEALRLSIGDNGLHILSQNPVKAGLTGRADRLPYRLDRSYGTD